MVEGSAPVSAGATHATGRRASIEMDTVSGKMRSTRADWISGMDVRALWADSRLSEKILSPSRMPVLASASSRLITPSVFTSTTRTS